MSLSRSCNLKDLTQVTNAGASRKPSEATQVLGSCLSVNVEHLLRDLRTRLPSVVALLVLLLVAMALGRFAVIDPQAFVVVLVLFVGVIAITAPSGAWIVCAVVVAVGCRGLVTLGVLPSITTYLDIPLVWGALTAAALRTTAPVPVARRHLKRLGYLVLAVLLSWLFNRTEVLRPIVYLLLLGEPFALVGAMLLDPPSPRMRRVIVLVAVALVAAQLPLAYWQAAQFGTGDPVQGTLYGAGAGAHTMSSVVVLGTAWLLARLNARNLSWRLPVAVPLAVVLLLAQAKQVLFTAPLLLLAGRWRRGPSALLRMGMVALAAVAIYLFAPLPPSTNNYLETAQTGDAGKPLIARFIWREITSDPASFLFGKGPAETVSRAAFMSTPIGDRNSALALLDLHPAELAMEADAKAKAASGADEHSYYTTSFNSATSSGFGVLGDLGLVGAFAYLAILIGLFRVLWRSNSPLAGVAAGAVAMFSALGYIFDWWEQPPFTVFVALLVGLALTDNSATQPEAAA